MATYVKPIKPSKKTLDKEIKSDLKAVDKIKDPDTRALMIRILNRQLELLELPSN